MERKTAQWLCGVGEAVRETRVNLAGGRSRRFGEDRGNEAWRYSRSPESKGSVQAGSIVSSLRSLRTDIEQRLQTAFELPSSDLATISARLSAYETRQTRKEQTVFLT